jgi:hypothetical protein
MNGKDLLKSRFKNRVKLLFELSKPFETKTFSYAQIEGLPEPIQRYFKFALSEGQKDIQFVRLTHDGQFRSSQNAAWTKIRGEQYFTTSPPGFIWKGSTRFFSAQDMYIGGHGRLIVLLLSFIKIIDGKGSQFDQGELSRWLAESVWFPTNLLPNKNVSWSAIDDSHVKLIFSHLGVELVFILTINMTGEIVQIESKRYMDKTKLEPWIIRLSDYKKINNIKVPTKACASWRPESGEFAYAKFNVVKMEYGKPVRFAESHP